MKKIWKRLSGAGLTLIMLCTLSGCGKEAEVEANINPDTPVEEVEFPLKEKKELSFITSAPATTTQDPNERLIFKRLEEQTNVHIDWTCFVDDQFADKKNLALAQFGNLPDGLFTAGMSDYDLLRYAKQGIIIPLENLIDKYMPNLQAVFEKYPEYKTMCTAPDGHIYSFPWIEQLGEGKEAIQAIGYIPYINKKWLGFLGLEVPATVDELEQVLIAFRDHAEEIQEEFNIEGDIIPMSFIVNDGDQDPAFLINGFGEGYGDTPDHFAVTDEEEVIYTAVQEGYKEGIQWLHQLVAEDLVDPEAFTQDWSTYVAKGKNHRYGLFFTWDPANIDNYDDYVMLPALAGSDGIVNITRQNGSETSGYDRGRCVLTFSCRDTALAAAWIDQMYEPIQSVQNNWGTYGEEDKSNIFEMTTNDEGDIMLQHLPLGDESPVEVRQAQSVNGPLAILNDYYDVYVTQPDDAKWRLDNMHETYLEDMNSKYVYPNVFMNIEDTNKVTQYDTDIKSYVEQKKADWILNGGIEEEWDSYLEKMEAYGLSDYLSIKQKYFDKYQESLEETIQEEADIQEE
ncbi:MAG: ABC transporter substrate-binding protein [Lachnospiraceae bacterium]